ncbi:GDP-mannose--glycolipid 4-beta-D-mannosyltransferase [Pseudoxanthomonas sp.]|uniref:GDP-mannose--glycolipid 4-beta-D-mannosyltransferase n=1 Tax=Pseudoxanthomonas sp. TaxID=1871049 RepID=UPI002583A8EA|nr:GDP-mannose--glycolipid 4-beta-D-mannosyltransferase [Pseudoxanthomonas sp.]MCR6685097.1 GDP-mannose--glycolipid 4-beta-D-mannosyltransferase [Pseudoxanthomonas sp.]
MSVRRKDADGSLVVLFSTEQARATTNPYLTQLYRSLPLPVEQRHFSMRAALLSRYDVLHLHWPEYLLRHPGRLGTWAKRLCALLLLARLRLCRTPVVRTLHNLQPHESHGAIERWLLARIDRATRRWIRINATTPARAPATDTILHGHYRDWFAGLPRPAPERGRLLHFGLLRRYKGVEALLAAMHGLDDRGVQLRICGRPADDAIGQAVQDACRRDPRISAELAYVDDATLAREVGLAELVVLPYRQMHNSGTLLLALSLERPVLAPWSEANAAIADEVGPGWVHLYDGELEPALLARTLAWVRNVPRGTVPDLSRRDWDAIGRQHHRSYLAALGRGVEARA